MPPTTHDFRKLFIEGEALIESGDLKLATYRLPTDLELSDEALIIGIMLKPDDLGVEAAYDRATIVQHEINGLITHEEAEAKLAQLDAEALGCEGDDEGDDEIE